ncbi:MAG: type II restriction endonuclease [Bacteroidetes bacterium]|nr:type II restriction endonuclease [Bacteroidota bacterium]
MNLIKLGSAIAKNGFKNEDNIVEKFINWKVDSDTQLWLQIMQYDINDIEFVHAVKISGFKTDVQVQVTIKLRQAFDVQNLQVKLVSNPKGFNQIDKRWVDKYVEMWNIPDDVAKILKYYTGELKPIIANPKDKRRMFANEFSNADQQLIIQWVIKNKSLIVSDILKGRGQFAAEWILVAQKINTNARWVLKPMNFCLNYFGNGNVGITEKGNFKIGKITIQRKGGDGGRITANMLQFKINPAELFEN